MPTITPREKIRGMIHDHFDILDIRGTGTEGFIDGVIALLEEARQEMKEKCLKCVPETSWAIPFGDSGITSCNAIRDSISSL